ncbi:MAG: alginate export family protein [Candidatus Omnitrophica bacterium]|nr:alginate export family protein [Candidatus Omnitrophota bacterium]
MECGDLTLFRTLFRTGSTIGAPEYTVSNSFDAIRATLDYDPWTIDMVYSKITSDIIQAQDDIDLYGVNVGYVFDSYNAEMEAYWFLKADKTTQPDTSKYENSVNTMGLRGSGDPVDWASLYAEGAIQFGKYVINNTQTANADRLAWAFDIGTEITYFEDNYSWQPKFGVEYIVYSGDTENRTSTDNSSKQYTGWDTMYRGKYDSKIREWIGTYYQTKQAAVLGDTDNSTTNQQQLILSGSIVPYDGVTLDARYINFWQQKATRLTGHDDKRSSYLGQELDLEVSWDYTEDVSCGFLAAWYFPGGHYDEDSRDVATDLVATMAVSF